MSVGKEQHLAAVASHIDQERRLEGELLRLKLLVRMVYRVSGEYAGIKPWDQDVDGTEYLTVANAEGRNVVGEHITDLIEQYESVNPGTL